MGCEIRNFRGNIVPLSREGQFSGTINRTPLAYAELSASAFRKARATAASSAGATVRGSNNTASFSIRPMMGGCDARSWRLSAVAPAGARTEAHHVGTPEPGNEPPPTMVVDCDTAAPSPPAAAQRRELRRRLARSRRSISQTGTSESCCPRTYDSNVALRAAIVSLSTRSARASGCRRSCSMRSARPTTSPD